MFQFAVMGNNCLNICHTMYVIQGMYKTRNRVVLNASVFCSCNVLYINMLFVMIFIFLKKMVVGFSYKLIFFSVEKNIGVTAVGPFIDIYNHKVCITPIFSSYATFHVAWNSPTQPQVTPTSPNPISHPSPSTPPSTQKHNIKIWQMDG